MTTDNNQNYENISPDLMADTEDDFYEAFGSDFEESFGGGAGSSFSGSADENAFQIPADFDGFYSEKKKQKVLSGTGSETASAADPASDPDWHVTVYGTRGSLPKPGPKTQLYGGNTSCVSVRIRDQLILFDAGSGISELGKALTENGKSSIRSIHLFLSHLHLDHIIGLLSFAPLFDPEVKLCIYSGLHEGKPVKDWLMTIFAPPFWPVTLAQVPAVISFVTLKDGDRLDHPQLGVRISVRKADHPDESLMYRLDALAEEAAEDKNGKERKSLVYGLDCELKEESERSVFEFMENTVLAICDAAYTPEDLPKHTGWGHSSWDKWADLLLYAGVHHGLMMHYSADYADEILAEEERKAREACGTACIFAKEGMELIL